jgi:phage gp36-like protein
VLISVFATIRDLDDLGISPEAFISTSGSPITDRQKKNALRAASGRIAPYLRKRYKMPLVVVPDDLDLSGITSAGKIVVSLGSPALAPTKAQDVTVTIVLGGVVGVDPITYKVTQDGTASSTLPLPSSGQVTVDNVLLTFSGPFAANDKVVYTTGVDWGVREATVSVACYILLHNRGFDPATEQDMKSRYFDSAIAFAKDLAKGEYAELETDADATPELDEGGPYGGGQQNPWDFLDQACGCGENYP